MSKQLGESIIMLESKKITDRKKACDVLINLLSDDDFIRALSAESWNNLLSAVQICLLKDADKIFDDMRKKGSFEIGTVSNIASDVFLSVLQYGLQEREKINVPQITGYIISCLRNDKMKKCYERVFLTALKDSILLQVKSRSQLEGETWELLYDIVKSFCEQKCPVIIDLQKLHIKCMMLIVKYAPVYGFPPQRFRNEFPFIISIVQSINKNHPRVMQEDIVEIITDFCLHTAKDNRYSCCELGECTFLSLIELYELNGREDKLKVKLIEYFLLQMNIHHPNGSKEGHPNSLAILWPTWKKYMFKMYSILFKEIDFYLHNNYKNISFFITTNHVTNILDSFKILFAELSQQLFGITELNMSSLSMSLSIEPASKKAKLEDLSLKSIIYNVESSKEWTWIHLVSAVIKLYPEMLVEDDVLTLQQSLSCIIVESQDLNLKYHAYECLMIVERVEYQMDILNRETIFTYWRKIAKFAVLSMNLIDSTQTLIKNLILRKNIVDVEAVLQSFLQTTSISRSGLKTSLTILSFVNFPRTGTEKQEAVIKWLFGLDPQFLSLKESVLIFGCLLFKQWPTNIDFDKKEENPTKFSDIIAVYNKINLNSVLEDSKTIVEIKKTSENINIDNAVVQKLVGVFQEHNCGLTDIQNILHMNEFIVNLLDFMMDQSILNEGNFENCILVRLLQSNMEKLEEKLSEKNKISLSSLEVLYRLFLPKNNKIILNFIRETVTEAILTQLFLIIKNFESEKSKGPVSQLTSATREALQKALSAYSIISASNELLNYQTYVLEILCDSKYDYNDDEDFKLILIFLKHLKYASPSSLSEDIAKIILNNLQEMCEARYEVYEHAVEILEVLKYFYSLIGNFSRETQEQAVLFLNPFRDRLHNYGPNVTIGILNCFEILLQVDPNGDFSKLEGQQLISLVPKFLSSDYVEVRLRAVETLVTFFKIISVSNDLKDLHRQEIIFHSMYEESEHQIQQKTLSTGELSNRNATVLLTFSTLMISCHFWIEECLFALIKLHHIQLGSVDKIISKVATHITQPGAEDTFLESHLACIIEKWLYQGFKIAEFPFKLFKCTSINHFYTKYIDICAPLLINEDKEGLMQAARSLGITEKTLIERAFPRIFTKIVYEEIENLRPEVLKRNATLIQLSNYLSWQELTQNLQMNLDKVILHLLDYLTDEKNIFEQFKETVMFYNKYLSCQQFLECLKFVKDFLNIGEDIFVHLLKVGSNKLERILLRLKTNIYNSTSLHDRLKYFHHYSTILNLIVLNLSDKSNFAVYFIRDTSYSMINLIRTHFGCEKFSKVLAMSFLNFLKDILPKFADIFSNFFVFTVNSLKNLIILNESVKESCLEILNFLIMDNLCHLSDGILKLDTFPGSPEFEKLNSVVSKIKYKGKKVSLKEEIDFFLNFDDECNTSRKDSIIHLRKVLSEEKHQLKELYEKLKEIRGFCEDCEESQLHRLVSTLVKMTWGTDKTCSMEAIKCLGELGPADLLTLILQPEKSFENLKCTPFEMICGKTVLRLSKYVVDGNIKIVETAADALYNILSSKEARKMAGSSINFGNGTINEKFLVPFIPLEKTTTSSNVSLQNDRFITTLNSADLWCPNKNCTHEQWIIKLVTSILSTFNDKSFLLKLIPICREKSEISEELLPLLIFLLLHVNNAEIIEIISSKINYFFKQHWLYSVKKSQVTSDINTDKRTVKCMLDVVHFVRLHKSYVNFRKIGNLNLSYLYVAQASQYCDDHFAALLYAELGCYATLEDIESRKNCQPHSAGYTKHDIIYNNVDQETGKAIHSIFRNAYKAIGDLDAITGCGISFILEPEFRVEYYKDTNQWDQVAHFYEMQVGRGDVCNMKKLMESFKMCSLYEVPLLCTNKTEEPQYECLWRLGQWTVDEVIPYSEVNFNMSDFDKYKYHTLKSLYDNDKFNFERASHMQGLCLVENLKNINLECSKNLYPILTQIQSLVEVNDFRDASDEDSFEELLKKWKLQDLITSNSDLQYVEPITAQRIVMLKNHLKQEENNELRLTLVDMMLQLADLARSESKYRVASRIISDLHQVPNLDSTVRAKIELCQAQLCWALNDKLAAKHILSKLGRNEEENVIIRSRALKLSGQYMVETYSENRQTIITDYFLKSLKIVSDENSVREETLNIVDTFDQLASFADREYQQIVTHMNSDIFQKKVVTMKKSKETADRIREKHEQTEDEKRAATIHDKQSKIDELEIQNNKKERDNFLRLALKYYLQNLHMTDRNNIRIFRVISLFLENRNNPNIKSIISTHLNKVPTYKYIDMLPQLVPHISDSNNDLFTKETCAIVEKCAIDHPHHTLPLLLALANANKDRDFTKSKTNTSSNDGRMSAAAKMLVKLKTLVKKDLIKQMNAVATALIELAYFDRFEKNSRRKEFSIPSSLKITKIKNIDDVLLPTVTLPVSKSNNYENIVGIHSFKNVFSVVGGINLPKRIKCVGTDGKERTQLVKGKDDLRQDSVMQQVFNIMNNLLASNKQTADLIIRTYKTCPIEKSCWGKCVVNAWGTLDPLSSSTFTWKDPDECATVSRKDVISSLPKPNVNSRRSLIRFEIVPLSMRSGVLEWVDNSMPIGEYLTGENGNNGAHTLYRPKDMSPNECRNQYKKGVGQNSDIKLTIFNDICKRAKPVFHKFFEETFLQPTVWYERRRAYIHSIATTSMCGYILGIGDRHVSNILVDKNTAEVIHIDFGIAFEQGRCLPTPETVPFRLTRDIVDGMGISGVEGIFKRSCEKTMEVLRSNTQTILTILEVLLYDPLYSWSVTPAEANKRQTDEQDEDMVSEVASDEDGVEINITAERALLRLRSKLQGTEEGNQASIEHQVGTLIQQAMDPSNLCRLFYGWQPYL